MKILNWEVQDERAIIQYLQNLKKMKSAKSSSQYEELAIQNAMLFDHIVFSIEQDLTSAELEILEKELIKMAEEEG